jgi:hypothetical protein
MMSAPARWELRKAIPAIIMIAARQYNVPPLDVFRRLTPDVLYSLMGASFRPMHALFHFVAILRAIASRSSAAPELSGSRAAP